jgi:hypothetical protein
LREKGWLAAAYRYHIEGFTYEYKDGPYENGIPSRIIEVGSTEFCGDRGGQDAYGAELESSIDIHIDRT